jgi:hypothetical protein
VTPTFDPIGPLCQFDTAPLLPADSKEGITGTWNPATINTAASGSVTYTFTPAAGQCATTATLTIIITEQVTPTFDPIGPLCQFDTAPLLPADSKEGITGTWNPATINTAASGSVTYTFTPAAGQCATTTTLTIIITEQVTPTFDAIGPLCQFDTAPLLPADSKEGITGTWNPATINTAASGSVTYTFTPTAGQCATTTTLTIIITEQVTPTFDAIGPLCQFDTAPLLPADSKEGITGTWNPATINTAASGSVTYTFTPTAGQCATTTTLTIIVNEQLTPTFDAIGPLWQNDVPPVLPTTSLNGIKGTWSPGTIDTSTPGTFTFTFTPDPGECALPFTMQIVIEALTIPTFDPMGPFCQNTVAPALPAASKEGITGIWSPGSINTSTPGTFTYTFTPNPGQGGIPVTMDIEILPEITPVFDQLGPFCVDSPTPELPLTSINNVPGTWSPADINTSASGSFTYTFTPDPGLCAVPVEMIITVTQLPVITLTPVAPMCEGAAPVSLMATPTGGVFSGTGVSGNLFDPSVAGAGNHTITYYYEDPNRCSNTATLTIVVNANPVLVITSPDAACMPGTVDLTAASITAGSTPGLTFTYWTNAGATSALVNPKAAVAGTYYIKGTTSSGCFDIQPVIVTIIASPDVVITDPAPICEPLTIDLSAPEITAGSTPGLTFTYWTNSDATISLPSSVVAVSGTYYIKGSTAEGCSTVKPVTVVINKSVGIPVFVMGGTSIRCQGAATVTYTATVTNATGLTYSLDAESLAAGNTINPSTGAVTYTADWSGTSVITATAEGCNGPTTAIHTVTIIPTPTAEISYPGSPFCTTTDPVRVTLTGTPGGTFSAVPSGLAIDPVTGTITPANSTTGTYTVAYQVVAPGGCGTVTAYATVMIIKAPTAVIAYAGPYCTTTTYAPVTFSGAAGGLYTALPAGLSINSSNGTINPSLSDPGTYTVTYRVLTQCGLVITRADVTITLAPEVSISYPDSPFCNTEDPANVLLIGTAGGVFTSDPAGLTLDRLTGKITPKTSLEGRYTVTYTIPAANGCGPVTVTAIVDIISAPTASIAYLGSPFCITTEPVDVTLSGTRGGVFSVSPDGLTIDPVTGRIDPKTSKEGFYKITYFIEDTGECGGITATTSIWILPAPGAKITYEGSPFCYTLEFADVIQTGTPGGKYTYVPNGLSIDENTGRIYPETSVPGTYVVTYTATDICGTVTDTEEVVITTGPTAEISYSSDQFCSTAGEVSIIINGDTGGTFTSQPPGLDLNPVTGSINPGGSIEGTYTVTYNNTGVGVCGEGQVLSTTIVTITAQLTASFYYAGTPFCTTSPSGGVTFAGSSLGRFTSDPGLSLNSVTGAVNPGASIPGNYVVTYTIPAMDGCDAVVATAVLTIEQAPTANISYDGPFCVTTTARQPVTLVGETGGRYTSTPGLSLNPVTGEITPSASTPGTYVVTYTVDGTGVCGGTTGKTTVIISPQPQAKIEYKGSPFCQTLTKAQPVILTGTTGGTFTSVPGGLDLDNVTGAIVPSESAPGKYQIYYTIPASGGCAEVTTFTSVTITSPPWAEISYPGSPWCVTVTASQPALFRGTPQGTYSASPSPGLSINGLTGAIIPSNSIPGTYVVSYTIPASGGCEEVIVQTTVVVRGGPTAEFTYPGYEFCVTSDPANVSIEGVQGGAYSATPDGLSIDPVTGLINPASSLPGTYIVSYVITASDDCGEVNIDAKTTVTISAEPVATFGYPGSPFCSNEANPWPEFIGEGTAGTFSSSPGLVFIDTHTGEIDLAASTPGTYVVTNTIPAAGGCDEVTESVTITISQAAVADFLYEGDPFCSNASDPDPTFINGGVAGTFSSTPGLVFIDIHTGQVDLSASVPGTYTVTNTLPADGGCEEVIATATITITLLPVADFIYPGPFCSNEEDPFPQFINGGVAGTFTSTSGLVFIDIHTGQIDLSASTAGTYTVTNTIAAAGGCEEVIATYVISIEKAQEATIFYVGSPFCDNILEDQPVILSGSPGGTYTSTPSGLNLNPITGEINPSRSVHGTYTVIYTLNTGGVCDIVIATTTVTITAFTVSISYLDAEFCTTDEPASVILNGSPGGVFTVTPAGLTIDPLTGQITPGTSTAGAYQVTYTNTEGGCGTIMATALVTIVEAPTAVISYDLPFCQNDKGNQRVTLTGTAGGTFNSTPAGLILDPVSGDIAPAKSIPGEYLVTYTIGATDPCEEFTTTVTVLVIAVPSASIYYPGSPLCTTSDPINVILTGTPGGTYASSPVGLTIDPVTGRITPETSEAGTYTITYTTPDTRCGVDQATANITITEAPFAEISYPGSPYCPTDPADMPVLTGTAGGSFSALPEEGLSIDPVTGEIDPATSTPGTYQVVYTIPAAGGCPEMSYNTPVTISTATIVTTPPMDQIVRFPANAGFGTRATGSGLTYQWQVNDGSGFVNITNTGVYSGAFTDSLQLTSPPVSMSGYKYRVIVSGICAPPAISDEAILIVTLKEFILEITAIGIDKMYDGNTRDTVTLHDNRQPGDVLTITYADANFDTKNVGTDKPVFVSGIVVTGPDAGKYEYNTSTYTVADIIPKPITVTATPGLKKFYGDPDPLFTYSYTPDLIAGDFFTGLLTRVPGENPGFYPILQGTLDLGPNYIITYISNDFEITYKTLIRVIVSAGQTKVYGDIDPVLTYTYYPELDPGDFFTGKLSRAAGENVGEYLINRGTLQASPKYSISLTPSYFTITPKPITVTAVEDIKVYDGNTSSDETPVLAPNLAFDDTAEFTQTYDHKNVGTGKTMTPSGRVNDGNNGRNYTVTYLTADLGIITPKPLVGGFTASDKFYDGTTDATILKRTLEGVIAGDQVGYVGGTATFDTPTVGEDKTVTGIGFSITGADAGNYTVNDTATTLADILVLVVPTDLTVNASTFNHYSDLVTLTATVYGGAPLANGPKAAETVTFTIEGRVIRDQSNNANIPLKIKGRDLVATITVSILETTITGSMLPGVKKAEALFNDENINYKLVPNPAKTSFEFRPGFTVLVYPNPSPGPVYFKISVDVGAIVTLDLYADNGQLVARLFNGFIPTSESKIVPVNLHLAQGIYRYRARVGNEIQVGNVIIIGVF